MPVVRGNYDSGQDYRLDYGELNFSFNQRDFFERVENAARMIGLVDGHLTDPELDDLVELVTEGYPPEHSRSDLGEHLHKCWAQILLVNPGPIHWIRRLLFRSAWCDQRVIEGELDIKYVDGKHAYTDPRRNGEIISFAEHPTYADLVYKP